MQNNMNVICGFQIYYAAQLYVTVGLMYREREIDFICDTETYLSRLSASIQRCVIDIKKEPNHIKCHIFPCFSYDMPMEERTFQTYLQLAKTAFILDLEVLKGVCKAIKFD